MSHVHEPSRETHRCRFIPISTCFTHKSNEWDPSVLDYNHPATAGDPTWTPEPSQHDADDPRIDEYGHFKGRVHHTLTHPPGRSSMAHHKHAIKTQPIDFEKLKPYLGRTNKHTIGKTFLKTTQWAVASTRYPMRKHFKSRFKVFNIPRRSEEVATDTIFSDDSTNDFLDGYATPLQCRTGLMYMNLLGKPTDANLNTFPHVLLTGPHE